MRLRTAAFSLAFLFSVTFIAHSQPNRHPLARAEFDMGPAAADTRLDRMILVLKSTDAQQQELRALLAAQQDPQSPLYHQWLTPEAFAERFGAAPRDLEKVLAWLGANGFSVDEIPAGGRSVIFSGSADDVQAAFQTALRRYRVGGQMHLANATEPRVPQTLAAVVGGVVSLHNFRRRPMHAGLRALPNYSAGAGYYYLAPADFATIYDVAPLYSGGINGAGQTIAVVARCNVPPADPQNFRAALGLPANNPAVIVNGANPGIVSDSELVEADLDVEWAGAVAPQATVDLVVSASTYTTDGVDLSAQYIVSHNLAPVMTTSFGQCEAYLGAAERAFYSNLWQQAAAQGITALVSSGDGGAAGCDDPSAVSASAGAAVNGLCSTPYSICVGGTQFNEGANAGQYWSSTNAANGSSARSYIPETVWNESGSNGASGLWASGGGASKYFAKPVWQAGVGVPADGKRDVPDVSLSGAGHDAYLIYFEGALAAVGGTSASAPAFAGLMALVNQQTGSRQGNANVTLYSLAALQAAGGLSYFHDIVTGNNTVPGVAGFNARTGYDLATGLGSVDAAVLVNHWNDANTVPGYSLGVNPQTLTVAPGVQGSVTVQVSLSGGFNAAVALSATGLPAGVTSSFAPAGFSAPGSGSSTLTFTIASSAAPGTYSIGIAAAGGFVTKSFTLPLTISAPPGCTLSASPTSLSLNAGSSTFTQIACSSVTGNFGTPLTLSATGAPQGVTVSFSSSTVTPGSGQSKLTVAAVSSVAAGPFTLTVTATGGLSLSLPILVTVSPAPAFSLHLSTAAASLLPGGSTQLTASTLHTGSFNSVIGLSVASLPAGVTAMFAPASVNAPGDGSSTLTLQAAAGAVPGTYNISINANGGGITQTAAVSLTVQVPASFTLSLAQKSLTVAAGTVGTGNITVSGLSGGFNSPVTLSVALAADGGVPVTVHPSFKPATLSAPGSGSSLLSFAPDATSPLATYSLIVTAAGAGVIRTAALSLTVTAAPSFSLKAAASSLNVIAGGMAHTQITATSRNSFNSTVTLSGGKLPAGVVANFSPGGIAANGGVATVNVQTTNSAVPGAYTLNIVATSGNVTATVPVTLNIGRLSVTATPKTLAIKRGSTGTIAMKTTLTGSYSGSVAFSATGLPKGVTALFSLASLTTPAGATTLTLSVSSTAVAGVYGMTINATSDGVPQAALVTLTVQ